MSKKAKARRILVKLVSTAGTGYFYVTKKLAKAAAKLELRKYDPKVRKHVIFKEAKMK